MNISELLKRKIPKPFRPPLRIALQVYRRIYRMLLSPVSKLKSSEFKSKFQKTGPLKLNIGCGKVRFPGWINIDIEPGADLVTDVREGLPFDDNSIDFIYNEHFWEHLTLKETKKVIREFYRCLKKGGVLRMATPDLDYLIERYNTDWKNQDWLSWPGYNFIQTKGQMINVCFRWWGHKYLYNEEDLRNQLIKAGFQKMTRCEWGKSNHAELCNLETREDSKLILEGRKNDICLC